MSPVGHHRFLQRRKLSGIVERRSPESGCYDKMLRENGPSSGRKSRQTVRSGSPICYGKLLRDLAKGLARRGRKLYYRHTIPVHAQRLLNRLEIWRSLRTESLAIALRRLPTIIARIEMEIEHAREVAGLPVDTTLIQSLKDDLAEHAIPLVVQHNPHRSGAYLRRELARRGPSSQELGPPTNPGRFRPRSAGLLPNLCSTSR